MNLLMLLGFKNPQTYLSANGMAWLRVIQSLAIGAVTTAGVAGVTLLTDNKGVTIVAIVVCVCKTFLDAFGHGLAKYVRTQGNDPAANAIDQGTDYIEGKLPPEFQQSGAGNLPPQSISADVVHKDPKAN